MYSHKPIKVLIVDDSEGDALLMARELERNQFQLDWERADSEAEYLRRLEQHPDVVLADYNMPQFSAPRALELLQERALSIPFIVVSGTIGEDTAVAIVKQGATDYVLKHRLVRLAPVVTRALQGTRKVAYFSMEIAIDPAIPTYSGGLGILAGDTVRAAADMQVPIVAVSLLHRSGYFTQHLDSSGWQTEAPAEWNVADFCEDLRPIVTISIEGRPVQLRAWKFDVRGVGGYVVPVYLLDSDLPANSDWDRTLTRTLYGGDAHYRLCQEAVLGVGGLHMLRALGYEHFDRFHMNEGHASLLTVALLREQAEKVGRASINVSDMAAVREKCIFTTHTPVPAGHDQFPLKALSQTLSWREDFSDVFASDVATRIFGRRNPVRDGNQTPETNGALNMTYLALNMSRYVNGVAKKHGEVSRLMFGEYQIDAITNGVHAGSWTSASFQQLFDRYIPDWRQDNFSLRYAESIPKNEIWDAHEQAKVNLIQHVNQNHKNQLDPAVFTVGLARRATAYKRLDLIFTDVEELTNICRENGPLQIVCAGKAHPCDREGKIVIQRIFALAEQLKDEIKIVFVEDYNFAIAKLVTSGVDLWLNTPQPPLEASGTSGMKAALNGIPSLSVVDGWWVEGLIEGITGWSIGEKGTANIGSDGSRHAGFMYAKLRTEVIPLFYRNRDAFIDVMRHAIAINGSFFNAQRMLQQYVQRAYFY